MKPGRLVAGLVALAALGLVLVGMPDAEAQPEPPGPDELVCVSVEEDVDCRRAAVSAHGDARCGSPLLLDDCVAASGTGDAACPSADFVFPPCPAVSLTGNASGELAVSGTGEAEGAWMDVSACESARDVDLQRPCHPSEGEVPPEPCAPHPPIRITEEEGPQGIVLEEQTPAGPAYRPGSGVVSGSGTAEDPYVIEGWCITPWPVTVEVGPRQAGILLEDTDAHVVVRDNVIVGHPVEEDAYRHALRFAGFDSGIVLQGAANVAVVDNRVSMAEESGFPSALSITDASDVVVEGNTFEQPFGSGSSLVAGSEGVEIRENTFEEHYGLLIHGSLDVEVASNIVPRISLGTRFDGGHPAGDVELRDNEAGTIGIFGSTDLLLRDNELERGLVLRAHEPAHVRHDIDASNTAAGEPIRYIDGSDVTVAEPAGQLIVAEATNVTATGLELTDVTTGAHVAYSHNVTIRQTTVTGDTGTGILVRETGDARVEETMVAGAGRAVSFHGSSGGVFDAEIRDNDFGIETDASDVTVDGSNIVGNGFVGLEVRSTDEAVDARDNWWGHASGPSSSPISPLEDACSDAVADGEGDEINTFRAEVCFDPWLTQANPDAGAG